MSIKRVTLKELDQALGKMVPQIGARPFVCDGSPLNASVFLVGLNPSTTTSFWDYWDAKKGLRRQEWLDAYQRKEGKLRRTRKYLEVLYNELGDVRSIEANLYSQCSDRLSDLAQTHQDTEVFEYLLQALQPRLVFAYGNRVVKHLERLTSKELPKNKFTRVSLYTNPTTIFAHRHLSYQLSKDDCHRLGRRLRQYALGT